MGQIRSVVSVVVAVLFGLGVVGGLGAATDERDPLAADLHPLVGAWVVTDADDPSGEPALVVFSADGTVIRNEASGENGAGAWEPTGDRSAGATLRVLRWFGDADEFEGTNVFRGTIEVDPAGDRFTFTRTGEYIGPDGQSAVGQRAIPDEIGTRIVVELPEATS